MLACRMSHGGKEDGEGGRGVWEKDVKIVEKKNDGNEFADGMLLFEGLIGDAEEEK
jgi:hypothetical protein